MEGSKQSVLLLVLQQLVHLQPHCEWVLYACQSHSTDVHVFMMLSRTSPLPLLLIALLIATCATSISSGKMMAQERRPRLTFHERSCCLPFLRNRALAWVQYVVCVGGVGGSWRCDRPGVQP